MRRGRRIQDNNDNFKMIMYASGSILGVAIILFIIIFSVYKSRSKENSQIGMLNSTRVADLVPSNNDRTEAASSELSRSINEMLNEANTITDGTVANSTIPIIPSNNMTNGTANSSNSTNQTSTTQETKKELAFVMPVEGEVTVFFAKDSLIYSKTLQEWIVHKGIDIKANKTTIVKASEAGTIKSIKNDPRYGLTIVIEHTDGYKTIYSSLLSSEFVVEGEKVEKGQTIGTVGNTAIFEALDDPHLHFELLKDEEYLDPMIYLK